MARRSPESVQHEIAVRDFLMSLGLLRTGRGRRGTRRRRLLLSIEELDDEPSAPSKTPWVDIADAFGVILRRLTMRQRQVLLCLVAGTMNNREIAKALSISTRSVRKAFNGLCTKARSSVSSDGV